MTVTFGTDDTSDLFLLSDGNIAVLSGLDAVLSACETASKAQRGEMVLATGLGIPNFQAVWVGAPNIPLWESALRVTLESVPGVLQVTDLTTSTQNNTLSYVATIVTQYGTGTVSG